MLGNAVRAVKGETVSASALWADHRELLAEITRKREEMERGSAASDDELLAEIASGDREAARRRKRRLKEALEDLIDAAAALEKKARAAEAKEQKQADAAAWATVDGLVRRRTAAVAKIDRAIVELATHYAEAISVEAQIKETIPKHQRPASWPNAGFGDDLGRAVALRLKLVQPAFDAMSNGYTIYVPRDWPTLSALVDGAHTKLYANRKNGEK